MSQENIHRDVNIFNPGVNESHLSSSGPQHANNDERLEDNSFVHNEAHGSTGMKDHTSEVRYMSQKQGMRRKKLQTSKSSRPSAKLNLPAGGGKNFLKINKQFITDINPKYGPFVTKSIDY